MPFGANRADQLLVAKRQINFRAIQPIDVIAKVFLPDVVEIKPPLWASAIAQPLAAFANDRKGVLLVAQENVPTGTLVAVVDQVRLGGIDDITFSIAR